MFGSLELRQTNGVEFQFCGRRQVRTLRHTESVGMLGGAASFQEVLKQSPVQVVPCFVAVSLEMRGAPFL